MEHGSPEAGDRMIGNWPSDHRIIGSFSMRNRSWRATNACGRWCQQFWLNGESIRVGGPR